MSTVVRVAKNKNYTIMSNFHLRDKRISLKAKGLMSFMLSLPEEWDYSVAGLVVCLKESRDAIRSALSELEEYGYLHRERIRSSNGRLGDIEYTLYETPMSENTTQEKSMQVKQPQIITKLNKGLNKINTDSSSTSSSSSKPTGKRQDDEEEVAKIFTLYQGNIHPLTGQIEADALCDLLKEYGFKWLSEAIKEAVFHNGRNIKYLVATLENWKRDGFKAKRKKPYAEPPKPKKLAVDNEQNVDWSAFDG